MKENLRTARLRRLKRTILFASSVGVVCWTPRAQAQGDNFAAPTLRSQPRVSVRELRTPAKARDEFERGLRRLAKRDAAGSLRHFDAAIRVSPEYYEAYYNEGVAEMQLRNNQEALRCFQRAIDLSDGSYARAEFGYGLALLRAGKAEEAERVVRHGLASDPNNADGHVVLGFVLLKFSAG
jgi:tetratricopeptide (TPR) repeat protein